MPLLPLRPSPPIPAQPLASDYEFQQYVRGKHSPQFIGRADELAQLDRILTQDAPGTLNVAIIHGIPGSGKTQLAVEYALQDRTQCGPYKPVFIEANTTDTFEAALKRFHRFVRKHISSTPEAVNLWEIQDRDVLNSIRSKLERSLSEWILIIDDITEDTFEHAQNLIPKTYPRCGRVILTTRKHRLAELLRRGPDLHVRETIKLRGMKEEDAVELLSRMADPYNDRGIRSSKPGEPYRVILNRLAHLPVLVNQFASLIIQKPHLALPSRPPESFIEHILRQRYATSPSASEKLDDVFCSFHELWAAILLQLRKEREVAADLLCMMSFLCGNNLDIEALIRAFSREYKFLTLCDADESAFLHIGTRFTRLQALLSNREELNVVLEMLDYMGILTQRTRPIPHHAFSSPMTQDVIRTALMPSSASRLQWLKFTLSAYQAALLPVNPSELLGYTERLAPHVERLWDHCREQHYCTKTLCELLLYRADRLKNAGQYLQALQWTKKAVQAAFLYPDGKDWQILRDRTGMALGLIYLRIALADNNNEMLSQANHIIKTRYEWCTNRLDSCHETDDALKAFVEVLVARGEVTDLRFLISTLQRRINFCENNPGSASIEALQLKDSLVHAWACIARTLNQQHLLKAAHDLSHATIVEKQKICPEDEEEIAVTLEGLAHVQWESHKCPGRDPNLPQNSKVRLKAAHSAVKHLQKARKLRRSCDGKEHPETKRISRTIKAWKGEIRASKKANLKSQEG